MTMERECRSCQKPFKPIKPNQKFCSQRCARKVRFSRYVRRKRLALSGDSQDRSEKPNENARDMERAKGDL